MVKKGQKITDPKVLERMKKMREKALATRRRKAEERRQAKLLKAVEDEKRRQKTTKKLKKMIVSDDEEEPETENVKQVVKEKPPSPREKMMAKNVKISKTITHIPKPKKRISYEGQTGEKELYISDCGKFVNVPIKDFNKFMFNHKENQEKLKNKKIAKPENIHINNYYGGQPPKNSHLQNRLKAQRRLNGQPPHKPMAMEAEMNKTQEIFNKMYSQMEW